MLYLFQIVVECGLDRFLTLSCGLIRGVSDLNSVRSGSLTLTCNSLLHSTSKSVFKSGFTSLFVTIVCIVSVMTGTICCSCGAFFVNFGGLFGTNCELLASLVSFIAIGVDLGKGFVFILFVFRLALIYVLTALWAYN